MKSLFGVLIAGSCIVGRPVPVGAQTMQKMRIVNPMNAGSIEPCEPFPQCIDGPSLPPPIPGTPIGTIDGLKPNILGADNGLQLSPLLRDKQMNAAMRTLRAGPGLAARSP